MEDKSLPSSEDLDAVSREEKIRNATGEHFVTGVDCTYFGHQLDLRTICPFCDRPVVRSVEKEFWDRIHDFELGKYGIDHFGTPKDPPASDWMPRPHPGYIEMWKWAEQQNRCFHHPVHMANAYRKYTGKLVNMAL